jgi:hypothetical protein
MMMVGGLALTRRALDPRHQLGPLLEGPSGAWLVLPSAPVSRGIYSGGGGSRANQFRSTQQTPANLQASSPPRCHGRVEKSPRPTRM